MRTLSVATHPKGRPVTKASWKTQQAPVKDLEFERSGPSPAFLDLSNDDVPLAIDLDHSR